MASHARRKVRTVTELSEQRFARRNRDTEIRQSSMLRTMSRAGGLMDREAIGSV